jgi:hypothetical protein
MWKPERNDVYLAGRTLGGALKASIHESGRCHVRAPDPSMWRSAGTAPKFLDVWQIDTLAQYEFPFAVVFPEPELRVGAWKKHRDRGTQWLPAEVGSGVEVAIFLIRSHADQSQSLAAAGWHRQLVDSPLSDGRRLLVVAGSSKAHLAGQADIEAMRQRAKPLLDSEASHYQNPRGLLFAVDAKGTRRFVEVSARE